MKFLVNRQSVAVWNENFGYSKKMEYMTLAVIVSGIINLFLNLTLIRLFSELGAALSFALSYLILTIISFLLNHYFVKLHSTSVSKIIKTLSVVIPFYFLLYYLFGFQGFIISFFFKLLALCILSLIYFWFDLKTVKQLFIKKL